MTAPTQTETQGLTPQEKTALSKQIESSKDYASLVEIGHRMFDAGETDIGIAAYEKALSLDGSAPDIWTNLGALYSDGKGDQKKAGDCFRKALALDPKHAKAHFNLGVVLLRRDGDVQGAQKEFSEYMRLDPNGDKAADARSFADNPASALRDMAQSDRGQGRMDEAEREIRAAMKLDPKNPEDWYWLGAILLHAEKYKEGLEAWARYEKLAPNGAKMDTVRQMRPNIQRLLTKQGGG